jgi:SOS-response transcriptional repressor LexA
MPRPKNPNRPLTARQQEARQTFRDLTAKLGRAPTVREFQLALGLASSQSAYRYLTLLTDRGHLVQRGSRYGYTSRTLPAPSHPTPDIADALDHLAAVIHAARDERIPVAAKCALEDLLALGWEPSKGTTAQ